MSQVRMSKSAVKKIVTLGPGKEGSDLDLAVKSKKCIGAMEEPRARGVQRESQRPWRSRVTVSGLNLIEEKLEGPINLAGLKKKKNGGI